MNREDQKKTKIEVWKELRDLRVLYEELKKRSNLQAGALQNNRASIEALQTRLASKTEEAQRLDGHLMQVTAEKRDAIESLIQTRKRFEELQEAVRIETEDHNGRIRRLNANIEVQEDRIADLERDLQQKKTLTEYQSRVCKEHCNTIIALRAALKVVC